MVLGFQKQHTINLFITVAPPTITTQPISVNAVALQDVMFTCVHDIINFIVYVLFAESTSINLYSYQIKTVKQQKSCGLPIAAMYRHCIHYLAVPLTAPFLISLAIFVCIYGFNCVLCPLQLLLKLHMNNFNHFMQFVTICVVFGLYIVI